jgi:hypothetical protein
MKNQYFTRTTYSFSPPNKETMDMLSFLCEKRRGAKVTPQEFQHLIYDLIQEAYKRKPSTLGI